MTHLAEQDIAVPPQRRASVRRSPSRGRRPRCNDARWPALAAALDRLHAARRHSVRIVDAHCGTGGLLLSAVRLARILGFTAIEARGIDDARASVVRARAAAAKVHDPAISITFETADVVSALDDEADFPADIVLWHGCVAGGDAEAQAVACAGRTTIADPLPAGGAVA